MNSQRQHPPRWANRFLEWYCADYLIDEIQGDLHEAFNYRLQHTSLWKARLWFVFEVLTFFKVSNIRKVNKTQNIMNSNYFKIAYRNFLKHKAYSLINLFGLIVGLLSCVLISMHVMHESSYDNFHPEVERLYRLEMPMYQGGELSVISAPTYPAVGPNLKNEFPEIHDYCRILPFAQGVYSIQNVQAELIRFNETKAVLADHNFFQLFGFKLVKGDPGSVLNDPQSIVISETTAKRYFGDDDPIGKSISFRGERDMTITGVMEDFPVNSHMQFDLISSLNTWDGFETWPEQWGWYDFYTFIKVEKGIEPTQLDEKLETYLDAKKADTFARTGGRQTLYAQPISDIHLHAKDLGWDMGSNGGAQEIYFLTIVAILIVLIAWVNFINLTTARAIKRAKEVGIRKVIGAARSHLIGQFLTETLLYNLMAVIISIILAVVITPGLNRSLDLYLNTSMLLSWQFAGGVLALIVAGTLLSGVYPALMLSGFKPINALKGKYFKGKSKFSFRQVLVVFQFVISTVLILSTLMVMRQLKFMQTQDLGLDVSQTLVLRGPSAGQHEGDLESRHDVFKAKVKSLAAVKGFTATSIVPGIENFGISGYSTKSHPQYENCYRVNIDDTYLKEFNINLVAGRNFYKDSKSDSNTVILNNRAVELLGFQSADQALNEYLNPDSDYPFRVVGVVEDYHHSSMKKGLEPIAFFYRPHSRGYYSLKMQTDDMYQALTSVERLWDEVFPDNPYEFFFLDERFNEQYAADQRFNKAFAFFAGLAIIIACLGLFGLVSFTVEQSRKEIGVRKVLGASVVMVFYKLIQSYAGLLMISLVIALPLGYYLVNLWLEDFAYKTSFGVLTFVVSSAAMILITFTTVSFRTISAAMTNPVDVLRDE